VRVARHLIVFAVIVTAGGAALAGCVALLVPAGAEFAQSTSYGPLLPEMNKQAQRSYVLDRNGNVMTTLFAEEDREPVTLANVPQVLIDAVLAIEDRRFYEHGGVDVEGTTRALFQNLDAGQVQQGGSTITQQLVKNTMGDPKKRDLKTKIREAVLALRLENEMSKHEILERYLNVVYFGNGAYGVKAASERYFNKPNVKDLTIRPRPSTRSRTPTAPRGAGQPSSTRWSPPVRSRRRRLGSRARSRYPRRRSAPIAGATTSPTRS
jgi:penicillin-binding protein 1A